MRLNFGAPRLPVSPPGPTAPSLRNIFSLSQKPSDHDLLRGIAARDVAAMQGLFNRYAPLMLAVSRRVLRDAQEAEDVVNEVFLELWVKPDRFAPERGAPRSYLLLVTRSRSIDRLRSRRSGTSGRTLTGDTPEAAAPIPGPSDAAEANEMQKLVRELLEELPESQRHAVQMSFFDGLSHQQIADKTEQPLGTVKGRIRQGLIRLRESMRTKRGGMFK